MTVRLFVMNAKLNLMTKIENAVTITILLVTLLIHYAINAILNTNTKHFYLCIVTT